MAKLCKYGISSQFHYDRRTRSKFCARSWSRGKHIFDLDLISSALSEKSEAWPVCSLSTYATSPLVTSPPPYAASQPISRLEFSSRGQLCSQSADQKHQVLIQRPGIQLAANIGNHCCFTTFSYHTASCKNFFARRHNDLQETVRPHSF
jgi:hypothetical protein